MKNFEIPDTENAIRASICFLENASSADLSSLSFNSVCTFIKNEIIKISKLDNSERSSKLFMLLDYRKTSNPQNLAAHNKSSYYLKKYSRALVDYDLLTSKSGKTIDSKINQSIDLLLHYLINQRLVVTQGKFFPLTDFLRKELVESKLWEAFPDFQKFFLLLRSPKTIEDFQQVIPQRWKSLFDIHLSSEGYRNLGNIVNCWRKVALRTNASAFEHLTNDTFIYYRNSTKYEADLPWGRLVPILNELGAALDLSKLDGRIGADLSARNGSSSTSAEDGLSYRIEDQSRFSIRQMPELSFIAGMDKRGYVVTQKKKPDAMVEEDEWSISESDYRTFSPINLSETLSDSPWINSQLEYLSSIQETGTRDSAVSALRDLNIYLFSYLKHFFECHSDLPYPFPSCPSEFKASIFIETSKIVNQSLYGNNSIFPLSFISVFQLINSELQDTVTHGKITRVRRYFDYCLSRYGGIPRYQIEYNPIDHNVMAKIKGRSYKNSSVKKVIEIDYWLLFSEYLIAFSDTVITMLENGVNVPHQGPIVVPLSGNIKALDYEATLSETMPLYLTRTRYDGVGGTFIAPQITLALSVMASSGLRLANAMWLEKREWDLDNSTGSSGYSTIEVATDKSKDHCFSSLIRRETYNVLKRFEALREKLSNSIKAPVEYKQSENSKWGSFVPLLGTGDTNMKYESEGSSVLTALMFDFESQLRRNNISIGEYCFYAPIGTDKNELRKIRKLGGALFKPHFDEFVLHYHDGQSVYFTPIAPFTEVTPHSLRKTLDTHLSLVIGAKFVGGLMTGQTEATVNYYTEVTPERYERTMAIKDRLFPGLPRPVDVNSTIKNEEAVREAFRSNGISGLGGFRLAVKELDDGDLLNGINANDISINATHICVHGNVCPPKILEKLGKKNCGLCPVAVSTASDIVAIAAQIRYHKDNIIDLNNQLKNQKINKSQRNALLKKRIDECEQAASWYSRYQFIVNSAENTEGFIVMEDGSDDVKRTVKKLSGLSEGEQLYCRLIEVQSVPTLQSDLLKRGALRCSRKILKHIQEDSFDVPDSSPIEISIALLQKVAETYNISTVDIKRLFDESSSTREARISNDFSKWLLEASK